MTDIDPRLPDPRYPDPPYSVDLLADLDAGVLDPDVAAHIRSRIPEDPGAVEVLAALTRVRTELRELPLTAEPVPDWVDARTQQTLAAIRDDVSAAGPRASATLTPLPHRRRLTSTPQAVALLSVAAAVLVAVIVGMVLVTRSTTPGDAPETQAQQQLSSTTVSNAGAPNPAVALSVLGRTDAAPFGSPEALRRCTAANGVAPNIPVLGSGPVMINGSSRVVILLGTGVAGRFRALVVGADCDTGNPALISQTIIGG